MAAQYTLRNRLAKSFRCIILAETLISASDEVRSDSLILKFHEERHRRDIAGIIENGRPWQKGCGGGEFHPLLS
jgi:hypothetical protein